MTVEIFDVDFLVPPTLHDARNAHSKPIAIAGSKGLAG